MLARSSIALAVLLCTPLATAAADWEGPYIGAYYGVEIENLGDNVVGLQAGYNFAGPGRILFGVEVDYGEAISENGSVWTIGGRVGTEVSPDLLLFGGIGYGQNHTGNEFISGSLGAQYAVTPSISLRTSIDGFWRPETGSHATELKLGAVYGF